jgi:hypothetical protein
MRVALFVLGFLGLGPFLSLASASQDAFDMRNLMVKYGFREEGAAGHLVVFAGDLGCVRDNGKPVACAFLTEAHKHGSCDSVYEEMKMSVQDSQQAFAIVAKIAGGADATVARLEGLRCRHRSALPASKDSVRCHYTITTHKEF